MNDFNQTQINIEIAFKNNQDTPNENNKIPVIPENKSTSKTEKAIIIHNKRILL